jgi:hypothetical protein
MPPPKPKDPSQWQLLLKKYAENPPPPQAAPLTGLALVQSERSNFGNGWK